MKRREATTMVNDAHTPAVLRSRQDLLAIAIRIAVLTALIAFPLLEVGAQPVNDDCLDATPVSDGAYPYNLDGSTLDGPTICDGNVQNDVWFLFTAPLDGIVSIGTCSQTGTNDDSIIGVYDGSSCPTIASTCLASADDNCGASSFMSYVNIQACAGDDYLIQVSGWGGGEGTGTLEIAYVEASPCGGGSGPCPYCPVPQSHLAIEPGMTVATFLSCLDEDGYVVAVYDTREPPLNAPGTNTIWEPVRYTGPGTEGCNPQHIHAWTQANLGSVFGVTLDDAVPPNIYVSATALVSNLSAQSGSCPSAALGYGPGGPGGVYRLDGNNGEICTVTSLPNSDDRVSLGQIDHAPLANGTGMLYVSNMDDGLIYAVAPDCAGSFSYSYDHGVNGLAAVNLPQIPDNSADLLTPFGRRVWGLQFNEVENRLYYSVWAASEYQGGPDPDPNADNEIWSVEIDPVTGDFIMGSATLEISIPPHANMEWPVSDIAFECGNRMILSERGSFLTNVNVIPGPSQDVGEVIEAHTSRVLEYTGSHLLWDGSATDKFTVGNYLTGQNSAGGVDFDADGNVVASGDGLHNDDTPGMFDRIYGFAIIPSAGSNPVDPYMLDSYLVDSDCDNGSHDKYWMFDVEHCRPSSTNCAATCAIENATILCGWEANTSAHYSVTFDVVNNSGFTVTQLVIPGLVNGVSVSPNVIFLDPPLLDNDIATGIQIELTGGAAGDIVCIPVGLMAKDATGNLFQCCGTEICVELPGCCMAISEESITVDAADNFVYNFTVTNLAGDAPLVAEHLFIDVLSPPGVSVTEEWLPLNGLGDNQSIALSTTFIGATPGMFICVQISMHDATLAECCGIVHCGTIPDDPNAPCLIVEGCSIISDIDADGVEDGYIAWASTGLECCQELYLLHNGAFYMGLDITIGEADIPSSVGNLTSMAGTWCLACPEAGVTVELGCCVLPFTAPPPEFLRGDANSDGAFDISDVVSGLGYLFQGQTVPCLVALDSNDDETVDISDSIYSLEALFGGGPAPWPPYQQCGVDQTPGSLGCESFPACDENDSSPHGG